MIPDPGADPAIGADNRVAVATTSAAAPATATSTSGPRVMCDLIHMAFVCDLTRAATLQITAFQSAHDARPSPMARHARRTSASLRTPTCTSSATTATQTTGVSSTCR